uniref:C-type lectin domain-containing protein n=1 Tax=Amphiprion percula TaxID=161767 RepID=A0A3P8U4D8_AMPPE
MTAVKYCFSGSFIRRCLFQTPFFILLLIQYCTLQAFAHRALRNNYSFPFVTVFMSTGSDYIIDETNMTWSDSKTNCERHNSTLAKILDRKTNSKIQKLLPQGSEVWLGLKKPILWSATGETSKTTFNNWKADEPNSTHGNENCVQMGAGGLWSDKNCELLKTSVCYTGKKRF